MPEYPKKILRIRDAVFVLPDDFKGTFEDAFRLFLKYHSEHTHNPEYVDPNAFYTPLGVIAQSNTERLVCCDCSLFELENGTYKELPKI